MPPSLTFFFFFNDTATTEIYTLSLHDALPISRNESRDTPSCARAASATSASCNPSATVNRNSVPRPSASARSEEHTSELQSPCNLVCRLLLEKKKKIRRSSSPIMREDRCRTRI